jgi:protein-S-isoprenylcysteine O-methyltransferase Ste14
MNKLNYLGIGPKIAIVLLPWLATTIILSTAIHEHIKYTSDYINYLLIAGIILMIIGFGFYFSTVKLLLKGLRETRLVTSGAYSLCQNPLYSSIILFIIPALSFILNSWLIITSSIIGYILFRIFIRNEYQELEKVFGDEYLKYRNRTPEFFPFSLKNRL